MKAVRFHEHGGLDVLRQEEVPEPEPGPGEVLIRVRACALNHLDLWQRLGIPGVRLAHCVGSGIAGDVVRASGGGVGEGQRVLVQASVADDARPVWVARTTSVGAMAWSATSLRADTPSS